MGQPGNRSAQGDLLSLVDQPAADFLKEYKDLPVIPLVTNFDFKTEKWRAKEVGASLRNPGGAFRKWSGRCLILYRKDPTAGSCSILNRSRPTPQKAYDRFIVELSTEELHDNNFELDLAVPFNDPAINYAALAKIADHLCV